jgi:hypothetical protein
MALVFLFASIPTVTQAESVTEEWKLTDQVGGITKSLCLEGDTLYIGSGLHVIAANISNPDKIEVIGSSPLLPQVAESIVCDGEGRLFVSCGSAGLVILDVADPTSPKILGTLDTRGYSEGAAIVGNFILIADGPQGIIIADISNPATPKIVSEAYPLAYIYDIVIQNEVAYAAGSTSGLFVLDIADPLHPVESGFVQLNGAQYDAGIANGRLYLAGAWGGVSVFDLTDPLNPKQTATVQTEGWAMALAISGENLLVPDGANGIDLYEISTAQPKKLSTLPYSGYVIDGESSGETAFVLDEEKGLMVFHCSAGSLTPVCRWIPLQDARRLDMSEGICYVAGGLSGLHAFDTNTKGTPAQTYWYDTVDGYANEVEVHNNTVYVAMRLAAQPPLMAFDISDPYAIKKLGILENSDWRYGIKGGPLMFDEVHAYMTGMTPVSIDIGDPANLKVLGSVDVTETGSGDVRGNLFIARSTSDMYFIDKSDPQNMKLLATLDVDSAGAAIRFISDTLVLVATNFGIEVYDVSNPQKPNSVSKLDLAGDVSDIFLDGDIAYLSAQGNGVHIVDLSNPLKMVYLDTVKTQGRAWDCYVQNGTMYVADGSSGVTIYQHGNAVKEPVTQNTVAPAYDLYTGSIDQNAIQKKRQPTAIAKPQDSYEYVVTSAEDSGTGTLRYGLESGRIQENTTITFDPKVFSPDNPATIRLNSDLPPIDQNYITIDASNAGVILDGGSKVMRGLDLYGRHITVKGMQLVGFTEGGIMSNGAFAQIGGNRKTGTGPIGEGNQIGNCYIGIKVNGYKTIIQGNLIGVDATGRTAKPNWSGIFITEGDNTQVGGTIDGEGNVVSASERGNITTWCDNIRVIGNIIGLDITGTKALNEQTQFGVFFELTSVNNTVGGATPQERNIISGVQTGVIFGDQRTYQCTAVGNYIGTDITGTKAIPNRAGFVSYVSYHNRVGGIVEGEGNVISGNADVGVDPLNDTFVLGNLIGLASDGKKPLPNQTAVTLRNRAMIGGFTPEEGNLICGGMFACIANELGVSGCIIAGNTFTSKSASGVWLQNAASDTFVQNNTFAQTSNFAVLLDGGSGNLVSCNQFTGSKTADFINVVNGGNTDLPSPLVTATADGTISGTTCPYGRVEIYLYENRQTIYIGDTAANANGEFLFMNSKPIGGKKILLLVTDLANNTSAFSKLYTIS